MVLGLDTRFLGRKPQKIKNDAENKADRSSVSPLRIAWRDATNEQQRSSGTGPRLRSLPLDVRRTIRSGDFVLPP